jgi:hypothetical protein
MLYYKCTNTECERSKYVIKYAHEERLTHCKLCETEYKIIDYEKTNTEDDREE